MEWCQRQGGLPFSVEESRWGASGVEHEQIAADFSDGM